MTYQSDYKAIDKLLTDLDPRTGKHQYLFAVVSALMLLIVYVLVSVVFQINLVHGNSMNNTLKNGDIAVSLRHYGTLSAGDIVILRNTYESDYIKRVVALPGDTVDIDELNGALVVNGKTVTEPYAFGKTIKTSGTVVFPMKLGNDEYFVLGDNREHSSDSRYFGAITVNRIGGVVLLPNKNR